MEYVDNTQKRNLIWIALLVIVATVIPFAISSFWLRIVTGVLMWIGLAQSWNILAGYMGYVSFGHGAFFGLGAYVTAIAMSLGVPFIISALIAGAFTAAFAAVIGYPTLRLQGAYFAIATWAFAEAIRQIVLVLPFTGGAYGMRLPAMLNENFFYYMMLLTIIGTVAIAYYLMHKAKFGLKVKAIREEETAANVLGLDVTRIKISVFALSAFFPGILGVLDNIYSPRQCSCSGHCGPDGSYDYAGWFGNYCRPNYRCSCPIYGEPFTMGFLGRHFVLPCFGRPCCSVSYSIPT